MICLRCNHYIDPDREMAKEQDSYSCECECHPWNKVECPGCHKKFNPKDLERFYDRHAIYSGRACSDKCAEILPGQGKNWNYDDSFEQIEDDY